jgi:hypothetical protein
MTRAEFVAEQAERQRAYRIRRRRWAWTVARPYSQDIGKPDPGVIDAVDDEVG